MAIPANTIDSLPQQTVQRGSSRHTYGLLEAANLDLTGRR